MGDDFDFFGADAWGEEPDWARDDVDGVGDDNGENGNAIIGAQHVLILLDCHSGMFKSIIAKKQVEKKNDDKMDDDIMVSDLPSEEEEEVAPFDMGLSLTLELLQRCIKNVVTLKIGKRNGVGLLLYHTKPNRVKAKKKKSKVDEDNDDSMSDDDEEKEDKADDEEDSDSDSDDDDENNTTVHVLLPLVPPGVNQVKAIRKCLPVFSSCQERRRNLQKEFRSKDQSTGDDDDDQDDNQDFPGRKAPLQTAIEHSMRMFNKAQCVRENKPTRVPGEQITKDTKSIWILTNRENPYPRFSSIIENVAKDAKEEGIKIELWPLPLSANSKEKADTGVNGEEGNEEEEFDYEPFFESIISSPIDESPPFPTRFQSTQDISDALYYIQDDYKINRRAYRGKLLFPDWKHHTPKDEKKKNDGSTTTVTSTIVIDWFRSVRIAKKPTMTTIDQATKRETIKQRQYVDGDGVIFASYKTPSTIEEKSRPQPGLKRLRQYCEFGDEMIPMTKDDMAELRYQANGQVNDPGLILLGFKPIDSIPFYHSMETAYLIYPNDDETFTDDTTTATSTIAFQELHASMLRKRVAAIGEVLFRPKLWRSKLVAIYPLPPDEDEADDDDSEDGYTQKLRRPPGMMVITLPFEDDLRDMEPDAATRELLLSNDLGGDTRTAASEGDLQPPEVPSSSMDVDGDGGRTTGNVASPELVDAAVDLINRLQLEDMEIGENFKNAALEDFFTYLEAVALELPSSTENNEYDTRPKDETILEVARSQIESFQKHLPEDAVAPPKVRKRKMVPDDTGLNWEELYRNDTLDSCKVDQLKSFLRSKGESTSGRKAILLEAVTNYLKSEQAKKAVKGGDTVKADNVIS